VNHPISSMAGNDNHTHIVIQPVPFERAKIHVFIEVKMLSLCQCMTLDPSRVDSPAWKRGDEVALLYYAIDWNDFRIWKPLSS